jgi:hypothetical protein
VDIVDDFRPGSCILNPLIIIEQANVIRNKPYFSLRNNGLLSVGLKLDIFLENIPSCEDCDKGYQDIPFSEKNPEQNKQCIDNEDKRVTHPDKSEYPVLSRAYINRQIGGDQ